MATVSVRYIVNDVDTAIAFYTQHLGFQVVFHPGPGFASLSRGDLNLLLSMPSGSGGAAQAMPDGRKPEPGGWNRIQLHVTDLGEIVEIGPRAEVLGNPRHPYTRRLLSAVPIADPSRRGQRDLGAFHELKNPIRNIDYVSPPREYQQVSDTHYVMAEA